MLSTCAPTNCVPFTDPNTEEDSSLRLMVERALVEKTRPLNPTDEECRESMLLKFLKKNHYEIEGAMANWTRWVQWRHDVGADNITDADIKEELASGIASWRGQDKKGRPCCVITGRMHDPATRTFTHKTFQKFLIRLVEDGHRLMEESGKSEVCILYDRRGLEFKHLDPLLHQLSKKTISMLREWYGDMLGVIYILHLNWYYSLVYGFVVKPLVESISSAKELHVVADAPALLEFFDEESLFLLSPDYNSDSLVAKRVTQEEEKDEGSAGSVGNPSIEVSRLGGDAIVASASSSATTLSGVQRPIVQNETMASR